MRIPMKPVSFMTSSMSVNGTRGNEFHRLAPSAQRTFLFAGKRPAERVSVVARSANAVRRVIVNDVTRFASKLPGVRIREAVKRLSGDNRAVVGATSSALRQHPTLPYG